MRKAEQRLWDSMRRRKPQGIMLERIENIVNDGTPDVLVKRPYGYMFVELKAVDDPPKRPTSYLFKRRNDIRPSQIGWFREAAQFHLPALLLLRVGRGIGDIYVFDAEAVPLLNTMRMEDAGKLAVARTWEGFWGRIY